jgi:hypothetical protein
MHNTHNVIQLTQTQYYNVLPEVIHPLILYWRETFGWRVFCQEDGAIVCKKQALIFP